MTELVVRLVFSLLVVVGLLLLLARVAQRRLRGGRGAMIRVVSRQPLGRSAAIAVVNVADRILVVGTTEHSINLLTEIDPDSVDLEPLEGSELTDAGSEIPSQPGRLAGSILSPQTWKQAMTAAQRGHRMAGNADVES